MRIKNRWPLIMLLIFFCSWHPGNPRFKEVSSETLPFPELANNTMDIEAADLDKDGDLDLVLAMEFKANIILINEGNGKYSNQSVARLPQVGHDSEDIALADFDKDGDIDIVFVSEDDRVHEYYVNDGKGYFTDNSSRFPVSSISNAIDMADYDKDGDIDLILGNDGQDFFLANDGKGNFTDETRKRMPVDYTVTQDVQSWDFDKDGDHDLVMGNENGNRFYLNDGRGNFTDATKERFPLAKEETRKIRLVDVNADGHMDFFICNVDFGKKTEKANRILVNNGKGYFKDETSLRLSGENNLNSGDAGFADFDGDGDLDMVLANLFESYSQYFENDGKGKFTEATDQVFAQRITNDAISVEVRDFNGDKRPDIYFGCFRSADRLFYSVQ